MKCLRLSAIYVSWQIFKTTKQCFSALFDTAVKLIFSPKAVATAGPGGSLANFDLNRSITITLHYMDYMDCYGNQILRLV